MSEGFEFYIFGLILLGVAIFHNHTLWVSLTGLVIVLVHKFIFVPEFNLIAHLFGKVPILAQMTHPDMRQGEWWILLNLAGLLLGFAILSGHFEKSRIPNLLPKYLPSGWKGPFLLLGIVFILSVFLDNIAAAMIGGTIAFVVFKNRIHLGYLVAIVAASNAGGSGSVIGDTTTTMMWIDGVRAIDVIHAYAAAIPCLLFFSLFASMQQHKFQPIEKPEVNVKTDHVRILIVAMILVFTILTNVSYDFPALGVWIAIFIGAGLRRTAWHEMKRALPGTIFLMSLVLCASLMPAGNLPKASWPTTFALGFVSAVFDNIPLTKLALNQGGYDWGMLAYAVGFGGSMMWFGSSAGVALSNQFPEAKSVVYWSKYGWHIVVAYMVGFLILMGTLGWRPHAPHKIYHQSEPRIEQAVH